MFLALRNQQADTTPSQKNDRCLQKGDILDSSAAREKWKNVTGTQRNIENEPQAGIRVYGKEAPSKNNQAKPGKPGRQKANALIPVRPFLVVAPIFRRAAQAAVKKVDNPRSAHRCAAERVRKGEPENGRAG